MKNTRQVKYTMANGAQIGNEHIFGNVGPFDSKISGQ